MAAIRAREPFMRSMDRVAGVLTLHQALHGGPGRPHQHVSDVLRGPLVLAVGALDGLVLEAVVKTVEPAARQGQYGGSVIKWAKEAARSGRMSIACANARQASSQSGDQACDPECGWVAQNWNTSCTARSQTSSIVSPGRA